MSRYPCKASQNPGVVPKVRKSHNTVSAVIPNLPAQISLMRIAGMPICFASRYWRMPIGIRNASRSTSPRPITEHRANPDFADGTWAFIDVEVSRFEGGAEQIDITLPRRLLAKIDHYAKVHCATRSGFLAEAARAAMR